MGELSFFWKEVVTQKDGLTKDDKKEMEHLPDFLQREQADPKRFAFHCLGASVVALLVGSAIDNGIAAAEKTVDGTQRGWAMLFFFVQLMVNILLLLMVCWLWKNFIFRFPTS
jgi:hypothetical protein